MIELLILIILIAFCGVVILKRVTGENRIQLILPTGVIIGIALYIFLVNLTAHFAKGLPGFYIALGLELLFTLTVKLRFRVEPFLVPKGKERLIWLLSLSCWSIFFLIITNTSGSPVTADATMHFSLAALFARGDYPIHVPWQPDYISLYHIGGAQFLGAMRSITNTPFSLIFTVLSFILLLGMSQILTWFLRIRVYKLTQLLLFFVIPAMGLISLGGFMLAWPFQLEFSGIKDGLVRWLGLLPFPAYYGSSTSLASLMLFFHRVIAISFLIALLPIIIYPDRNNLKLTLLIITIITASTALADEAVFIAIIPAILIVSLFSLFKRSLSIWLIFCLITLGVVTLQGGIITEAIFNGGSTGSMLIFPKDQTGPLAKYHNYRSYRLIQLENNFIPSKDSYTPFKWLHEYPWFHPSIILQLALLLVLIILTKYLFTEGGNEIIQLLGLLFISALAALIAYFGLVPKGYLHLNGDRFLALAYHFSGLGIILDPIICTPC